MGLAGRQTPDDVLERAIADGRVLVAASAEGLRAYVRWEYFWDTIPLCVLVRVRREYWRCGVGRALYAGIEDALRGLGHGFWLSSTEATNERSQRFHEALGFRRIGVLQELGQDVPEIFYRKEIG